MGLTAYCSGVGVCQSEEGMAGGGVLPLCSCLGEWGLWPLASPLPPISVCLMLMDWREGLGDGSVLLLVGL